MIQSLMRSSQAFSCYFQQLGIPSRPFSPPRNEPMATRTKPQRSKGLFITLEGPEGSGKSTQIGHLFSRLRKAGYFVVQTREPGGTPIAESIRNLLLLSSSKEPISAHTEALLILAARSQHVAEVIKPALERGAIVLCDRFSDSTLAYQGYGRGLDRTWLREANTVATRGITPDRTLLLDLPVTVGLARRRAAAGKPNRLDRESVRFHERVRQGFLSLAKQSPERFTVIDANRSAEAIRADVASYVVRWVSLRRLTRKR